jgi:hypothetical protein
MLNLITEKNNNMWEAGMLLVKRPEADYLVWSGID